MRKGGVLLLCIIILHSATPTCSQQRDRGGGASGFPDSTMKGQVQLRPGSLFFDHFFGGDDLDRIRHLIHLALFRKQRYRLF